MHGRSSLRSLLLAPLLVACGSDTSFTHEAALIGQFRDIHLGDEAADVHARWWDVGGKGSGEVIRQEFVSKEVFDRLGLPHTAELRDVTEKGGIRVLFVERAADAEGESAGTVVIATTTQARELFSSDTAPLYDAVLTPKGFAVALRDPEEGCVVRWLDADGVRTAQASLDRTACAEGLQIVSARPGNMVGYSNGVVSGVARSDSVTQWEGGGDLLSWDPLGDALIVATQGDSELRAWFDDGTEAWYTDIGQSVDDLDSLGVAGTLALATSVGSGGRIVVLDAFTGDALTATDIPIAALELSAGSAGTHVALSFEDELHLFRVDPLAR